MIEVGQKFPNVDLFVLNDEGPTRISSKDMLGDKRVALFGLPGAYTRTCSASHFPGFLKEYDALKSCGIDEVICLSTNDVFVLNAWSDVLGGTGKILMVGDGCLDFTRAAGLEADMSANGYGTRCRRFSMIVDHGTVTHMHLEAPGEYGATSAETLLKDLR